MQQSLAVAELGRGDSSRLQRKDSNQRSYSSLRSRHRVLPRHGSRATVLSRDARASMAGSQATGMKLAVIKDLVKDEVLFMHPTARTPKELDGDNLKRQEFEVWYLKHSAIWQTLAAAFSVISAVLYLVEIYAYRDRNSVWCDFSNDVIGLFFVVELGARWYIAHDRLQFLQNYRNILDIVFITPTVLQHFVQRDAHDWARVVFSFQFLRLTNIIWYLRARKVGVGSESVSSVVDPSIVRTELRNLILSLLALILAAAALVHVVERYGSIDAFDNGAYNEKLDDFHSAIYFLVITLTTVGYGDIAPQTLLGKILIMSLVVTSIIVIPRETAKISEMMTLTSAYAGSFTLPAPHVVVIGHIDYPSLKGFLDEFFHEAHGQTTVCVVILSPVAPSKLLQLLIGEGGEFCGRVHFFEGSALDEKDLERVAYHKAVAGFFLTNKGAQQPYLADHETIMRIRSCKNFKPSVPVFAQTLLEDSMHEATCSGADYLICISAIKTNVLVISSVVHGFSTLFLNLFRNEAFTFTDEGHWMKDYCHGVSYEIYTIMLPKCFHGQNFGEATLFLYREFGALLFGIKRANKSGVEDADPSTVFLNPYHESQELRIQPGDVGVVFATDESIADEVNGYSGPWCDVQSEMTSPQSGRNKQRPPPTPRTARGAKQPLASPRTDKEKDGTEPVFLNIGEFASPSTPSEASAEPPVDSPRSLLRKTTEVFSEDVMLRSPKGHRRRGKPFRRSSDEQVGPPALIPLFNVPSAPDKPLTRPEPIAPITPHTPFVTSQKRYTDMLGPVPHSTRGHIIVVCPESDFQHLTSFVSISRSGPHSNRAIVVMAPLAPRPNEISGMMAFSDVHIVRSTGKRAEDWQPVMLETAHSVVILSTRMVDDESGESDMMGDYDALSIFFSLKTTLSESECEAPFYIVELINRQNLRYFHPKNDVDIDIDESTDYVVPAFASGNVYSNTGMDSLLCQVFYNPDLLTILQKFLDPTVAEGNVFSSCSLYSIVCPEEFIGRTFGDVLEHYVASKRWLPIGLYRGQDTDRSLNDCASETSADLPSPFDGTFDFNPGRASDEEENVYWTPDYVFICPPRETVLTAGDSIYIFANVDPMATVPSLHRFHPAGV